MKKAQRNTMNPNRIKPLEGIGLMLLFLGAFLVFLWVVFIVVRLVMG